MGLIKPKQKQTSNLNRSGNVGGYCRVNKENFYVILYFAYFEMFTASFRLPCLMLIAAESQL